MAIADISLASGEAASSQPINIEAWTEQAAVALSSVTISVPGEVADGPATTLAIPLDEQTIPIPSTRPLPPSAAANKEGCLERKELIRRDSQRKREAVLKGREGSRRRLRWENDRLLNNPHAEPPLPKDWEVHPTYRVTNVPYYLAPLWDAGLQRQSNERKLAAVTQRAAVKTVASKPTEPGIVPKELRQKLKRSRGAKGLLMDLEGAVRTFVTSWEEKGRKAEEAGLPADPDSEDDEIVFVGRNGAMNDQMGMDSEAISKELMLFETPEQDVGGTFGRWLVHHIGVYYGLSTWSITKGDPARREAYIGLKGKRAKNGASSQMGRSLPRPLYGLV